MKTPAVHPAHPVKNVVFALVFACGLFASIAFLDGVAQPDDVSPGTAFAATLAAPPPAPVRVDETWAADTSAAGTRPDAIH